MEDILAEAREEFAGDRFAMGTGFRAGGGKWAGHRAGPEKSGNPAGSS